MSEQVISKFKGKKVLVAGASGFLGGKLSQRLAQIGADVVAVARRPPPPMKEQFRWWQADLSNLEAVRQVFMETRPDTVYQLCGRPDGARDLSLVVPILESDVRVTVNLLIGAVEHPVRRFITTASLEEPIAGEPPTSPYAAAKMASTAYARMFHLIYNVPVVILRPFMTYGPGQPEKKVVSFIVKSLLAGEPPKLSSGNRMVDWVFIDDVIQGFLAAAIALGVEGSTFDLGTGMMVSIRDVADKLSYLTQSDVRPVFGALQDRPFERVRAADTESARVRLGWQPKVSLDEGLRLTVEWWKERLSMAVQAPFLGK